MQGYREKQSVGFKGCLKPGPAFYQLCNPGPGTEPLDAYFFLWKMGVIIDLPWRITWIK